MARPFSLGIPTALSGNALASFSTAAPTIRMTAIEDIASDLKSNEEKQARLEEEQNERADRMRGVQAENKYELEATKRVAELNPKDADYEEQVQSIYREEATVAGEASGMVNAGMIDEYNTRAENAAGQARLGAYQKKRGVMMTEAATERDNLENALRNRVRENPDDVEFALEDFKAKASRINEMLPPAMVAAADEALKDQLVIDAAEGLAEAGRINEAMEFLDSDEAAGVDPASIRTMKRRVKEIEGEQRRTILRETKGMVAELDHRIRIGEAGAGDIKAADAAGLFDERPEKKFQLMTLAAQVQKARANEGRDATAANEKYAAGGGLDTQAETDLVWEEYAGSFDNESGQTHQQFVAAFTKEATFVPKPVRQMIQKGNRTADANQLAEAATYHREITNAVPSVNTGAGKQVEMTADLIGSGMHPLEAAKTVREQIAKGGQPVLNDKFKEEAKDDPDWAQDFADRLDLPIDLVNTDPALAEDHKRLSKSFYLANGGDWEAARSASTNVLSRTRGASTLFTGGEAEFFVKYDPVSILADQVSNKYATRQEMQDLIEGQVRTGIEASGLVPGVSAAGRTPWGMDEGRPPVKLQSTDATRRTVEAGDPAVYLVLIRNEAGGYERINKANGEPLTYTLPSSFEYMKLTDTAGRMIDAERKRGLDRPKNVRKGKLATAKAKALGRPATAKPASESAPRAEADIRAEVEGAGKARADRLQVLKNRR